MNRYLCVHGHFYQPPRENPGLEEVELQDSAYPYHDWNERITTECYAPNTASRILNRENKIVDIVNNYSKISFNYGPTLLSWMQRHRPQTYKMIIAADMASRKKFSGHGSAIAQVYNHMIMPLANTRDKYTQVIWGIKDFVHRFGRQPEGMWLAETAVDTQTLEILSEQGIKFTILSPYQARRIRKSGDEKWHDVSGGKIDPKVPYKCVLPSGRTISIFFYDGPVSQDIAFGGLLNNGENLARRLLGLFDEKHNGPQLAHIATDGETYGHHHHYGEMALSYAYHQIAVNNLAIITVYGEYLEKFPPQTEVQIIENSSWSCFHGIERWRGDCGCKIGTNPAWNQSWRVVLRVAMDWLRDNLSRVYEESIAAYLKDPWQARNDYIGVVLERTDAAIDAFFSEHALRQLSEHEKTKVIKLLEMQRHAMLMYTSCGWFFDDISTIESVQVMNYAGRAIQLAKDVSGIDLEPGYLKILKKAKSNVAEYENGAMLYELFIKPAVLDLQRIAAHYAVSSLFTDYETRANVYAYTVESKSHECLEAGKQRIVLGNIEIVSRITRERGSRSYAVLHLGDHIVFGGICNILDDSNFALMQKEIKELFQKSDVTEIISLLDRYFDGHEYKLWHLFRDERRKVLGRILAGTLHEVETSFRQINENHYPIMLAMKEMGVPFPKVFTDTMEFISNNDIKTVLEEAEIDFKRLHELVQEVERWTLSIDRVTLGFVANKRISAFMEEFSRNSDGTAPLEKLRLLLKTLEPLSLQLRLWEVQNIYFAVNRQCYGKMKEKAVNQDNAAKKWVEAFDALGTHLYIRSA